LKNLGEITKEWQFPDMGSMIVVSPEGDFNIDGKMVHAGERVTIVMGKGKKTISLAMAQYLIEKAINDTKLRELIGIDTQATFG
jgi:hypothetical protein